MSENPIEPAVKHNSTIQKAYRVFEGLLVPGEQVQAWSAQQWLPAVLQRSRRGLVAATSSRLIYMRRRLLGGFELIDFQWQDLHDARLDETFLGGNLIANSTAQKTIRVRGLEPEGARRVYAACQAQEQTWREKHRIRAMEEERNAKGFVPFAMGASATGVPGPIPGEAPSGGRGMDPAARLAQAKAMLDKGLISDAEYETIKAKIFAAL